MMVYTSTRYRYRLPSTFLALYARSTNEGTNYYKIFSKIENNGDILNLLSELVSMLNVPYGTCRLTRRGENVMIDDKVRTYVWYFIRLGIRCQQYRNKKGTVHQCTGIRLPDTCYLW